MFFMEVDSQRKNMFSVAKKKFDRPWSIIQLALYYMSYDNTYFDTQLHRHTVSLLIHSIHL